MNDYVGLRNVDAFPVEAFCIHCGLIQQGTLYPARYGRGYSLEQVVIVHCTDCSEVSRHHGGVQLSGITGTISVVQRGDGKW